MPKQRYVNSNPNRATLHILDLANALIEQYTAAGYSLTLRQVYYQFIARDLFPDSWIDTAYNRKQGLPDDTKNTIKNYKRLGETLNQGRLTGHIDWLALEDRTRNLESLAHWEDAEDALLAIADQFRVDKWENQRHRVEIWIEKDALVGIVERIAQRLDCAFFACRGYVSASEVYSASQRYLNYRNTGQEPIILHLGDHDPSGMDMTRDIRDRLATLMYDEPPTIERLALNMDQVQQWNPPPNPAKITDSRAAKYIDRYGSESWELDALDPKTLNDLIRDNILRYWDADQWREDRIREETERLGLNATRENWDQVFTWMQDEDLMEDPDNLRRKLADDDNDLLPG